MLDTFKKEIDLLCEYGNLGFYQFCEITQVILINKADSCDMVNYFTHIDFSSEYSQPMPFSFISQKPKEISHLYQLAIGKYRLTIDEFKTIYCNAIDKQAWNYNGSVVKLDDIFPTTRKYIPDIDPTNGRFDVCIPIEMSLYGSNFMGNYYVVELFSKKSILSKLTKKDIVKIQAILVENKLDYNIERLQDRIGNVICKFHSEILLNKSKSLSAIYGIECQFSLNPLCSEERQICIYHSQEFDGVICDFRIINNFNLNDKLQINPNQYKNTITAYDCETGLILFMLCYDYTQVASYNSVIIPEYIVLQGIIHYRKILIDGVEKQIGISRNTYTGNVYSFVDNEFIQERQKTWDWEYLTKHKQLISYDAGQHEKALNDIVDIINLLSWDLKEVCIIDPYLQADDILRTAAQCDRENISIKCLCDYSALHGNAETKIECSAIDIQTFKNEQSSCLTFGLTHVEDLDIEYRAVYGEYGSKFHDRFLILKFKINGTKVWSLGASINSIGSKHSIIQIVANPEIISGLFDKLWAATDYDICKIFKKEIDSTKVD